MKIIGKREFVEYSSFDDFAKDAKDRQDMGQIIISIVPPSLSSTGRMTVDWDLRYAR